ncbi:MAG: hypothetical protein KAH44_21850 [Oricola sp.]|nr:hypothetical protein [Oricola sp.]
MKSDETWAAMLAAPSATFEAERHQYEALSDGDVARPVGELPDIAWAQPGVLAFSDRLRDIVDWPSANGSRAARMSTPTEPETGYRVVLPENSCNLLDVGRSTVNRFVGSGRIMDIRKWVLKRGAEASWPLFRMNVEGEDRADLFVNDGFIDRVSAFNPTGVAFRKIEVAD